MLTLLSGRHVFPDFYILILTPRQVIGPDYIREVQSYNGRERVLLRKRRTKLRVDQFRIIAQVGQGGYGSVYLARKADTNEICALKKMRKGTLAKMDEVKHVLVERDILCAVKTPWLVRLLYAFQDKEHVYLAMVSPKQQTSDSAVLLMKTRATLTLSSGIRSRRRFPDSAQQFRRSQRGTCQVLRRRDVCWGE